ncbi:MAG: B12-binding domain-containing radical SAM protein [Candidatus Brocadia sp.]|nr:B12-binding domain-containing radical SAM protein [Candidatus Brocadia sp.]
MNTKKKKPIVGLVWLTQSTSKKPQRLLSAHYHLGCGYLQAFLQQGNIKSKQYVLNSVTPEDFARTVVADGIKILGFSCDDTNYYAIRRAALSVKALNPSILIVAGGLTATYSDELVLRNCQAIDICFRGYSEINFLAVVKTHLSGQTWYDKPAITYRKNSEIFFNPNVKKYAINNLDYFPSPYLSGFIPGEAGIDVGISTSRGCVFHCTFCNPTAMVERSYAFHSNERVLSEIDFIDSALHRSGMKGRRIMLLNEDIFALHPDRTKKLCNLISENQPKHILFGCETRIEHLTEDILQCMYSAGFRLLKFGLESGNPRVLNLIKKVRNSDGSKDGYAAEKDFLERIVTVVQIAKKIGFHVVAGTIFGLPGESLADAIETLDFIRRIDVDEYYHNFLHIFPGTEIFKTYKKWGYQFEVHKDFYPTIYHTYWPYPVELVPTLQEKLDHSFRKINLLNEDIFLPLKL